MTAPLKNEIENLAAEHGFSAAYCVAPVPLDGAPDEVKTLVLLVKCYAPGGKLADAFYPASNAAYHATKRMAESLTALYGWEARHLPGVRLKPVCARLPVFGRGINTLNYLPGAGSRFCMELLGLTVEIPGGSEEGYPQGELPCARCMRCARACPTGAITGEGFIKERCIRFHMLSGKAMPEEMRPFIGVKSMGIVGCDLCQRVCPANAKAESGRTDTERFTLDELLACDRDTQREFAALYGANYALRNRILAQAVLAAANTGEQVYLPRLGELTRSPSAVVAEHARWACEKLTGRSPENGNSLSGP